MQKESPEIDQEVLFLPADSKPDNEEEKKAKETEELGVEATATVDSRIYERPSTFLGLTIIILIFGGIVSKYESIFSLEYEGKTAVVLYHGLCLISAGDRLIIHGKWYQGKKLGIEGNVIVADKVENLSSGIIYSKK